MRGLADKKIIVTGGSSGIGHAVVKRLLQEGSVPIIFDIANPDESGSSWFHVDVSDVASIQSGVDQTLTRHGSIDGLVTCAGIDQTKQFLDITPEDLRRMTSINYHGTFFSLQLCARAMIRGGNGGSMVTVSSIAARGYRPLTPHYAAAKAAVLNLTTSVSSSLAPHNIRVNTVVPGVIDTAMMDRILSDRAKMLGKPESELRSNLENSIPLGHRFASPEEVASVIAFLLSDEASYVTGESFGITGGLTYV